MPKKTSNKPASAKLKRRKPVQCSAIVGQIGPMPTVNARRPYDDRKPQGYLESFNDWAGNNVDAVTWFLENSDAIRAYLPND